MSEVNGETTVTKILTFGGSKKLWPAWKEKFLARAYDKGYRTLLEDKNILIPKSGDTLDETTEEGKKKAKIRKANSKAYTDLVMCMDCAEAGGRVAMNIVRRSKTKDYKYGHARNAWLKLKERYEPKSAPSRAKLQRQFYAAKCRQKEDPELYITYMEDLRMRLVDAGGEEIGDEQFMIQVLNTLPEMYDTTVEAIEDRVGSIDDPISIDEIEEKLSLRFERINMK